MKKLLLILSLSVIPTPVHAITWNQFWAPFAERPYYPYYQGPYVPSCTRKIIHEDYIPSDGWRPAYVRVWSEFIQVPCDY